MIIKNVKLKLGPIDLEGIDFNQLTILVGANGTGKSLILKMNYIMPNVLNLLKQLATYRKSGVNFDDDTLFKEVQNLFDRCFDSMDFTGHCYTETETSDKKSVTVNVEYIDGKITNVSAENIEDWEMTVPLYMSSEARLFSFLNGLIPYMPKPDDSNELEKWKDLSDKNKMYNISYAMMWARACPYTIPDKLKEAFKEGYEFSENDIPNVVDIDYDKYQVFGLFGPNNERKNLGLFGNGHQAIFNMLISVSMSQRFAKN